MDLTSKSTEPFILSDLDLEAFCYLNEQEGLL